MKNTFTSIAVQEKFKLRPSFSLKFMLISFQTTLHIGGAVALWLASWSPNRAVWVQALAWVIVLCSWARRSTLTVPVSPQV